MTADPDVVGSVEAVTVVVVFVGVTICPMRLVLLAIHGLWSEPTVIPPGD